MTLKAKYPLEKFKTLPEDFRIGLVISDGMWYSLPKWRKLAKVTEPIITKWIEENLESGRLIQAETGAKSYRFSLDSIREWYDENNLQIGEQLVDFLFPARIWADLTETEGFVNAPLREIGIVSFKCSTPIANEVTEALRGVARVRESEPGQYKAYCLDATFVKSIIEEFFSKNNPASTGKIYSRAVAKRRELADFPKEYGHGIVMFYKHFGKSLVKRSMDTISIFLPEPEDQDAQIIMWVITAIEKFDESTSVPFSGYLNSVLRRWPYDLPTLHLGKELSDFQRQRSKAIEFLKTEDTENRSEFPVEEVAEAMGIEVSEFQGLQERHQVWIGSRNAGSLNWTENNEEKDFETIETASSATDITLANKLSFAVIRTALTTGNYDDALHIISQIDASNINIARIREVSDDFIQALGEELGIEGI